MPTERPKEDKSHRVTVAALAGKSGPDDNLL